MGRTDLDRSLLRGAAWTTGAKTIGQVVSWVATLAVARLLMPADYAIFGMATVYLTLLQHITEFGIGTAIVSRPQLGRAEHRQLNALAVAFGVGAALIVAASSPLVARFFRTPNLVPVLIALSGTFIITGFRTVPWALLQRDLRFRRLAVYDAVQAILLALSSIALARAGFGYWTLVSAALLSASFGTIVALRYHPVGFARPDWGALRSTLTLGADLVAQRLTWWGYANADFAVAGRMLAKTQVGAYSLALTLAASIADRLGAMLLQVVPAVLARAQDDRAELRRYVLRITEVLALVLTPVCVGIALVAPEFVGGLLGAKWLPAVPALQLLSIYVALRGVLSIFNHVLVILDRQRMMTYANVALLILLPPSFFFASAWGITGIAAVWVIVYPIVALCFVHVALRVIGLGTVAYVRDAIWPAVSACVVMAAAVLGMRMLLPLSLPVTARLGALIVAGAAAYPLALLAFHRGRVLALRTWFQSVRAARAVTA